MKYELSVSVQRIKQLVFVTTALVLAATPVVILATTTLDTGTFHKYYEAEDAQGNAEWMSRSMLTADIDADGIADLIVGGQLNGYTLGKVAIIPGSTTFGDADVEYEVDAVATITGVDIDNQFGSSVAAGDLNGDGYDDLVVASQYNNETVDGFYGPLTGNLTAADADFSIAMTTEQFDSITIGDIDSDGFEDLLVSQALFYGSGSGITATDVYGADATFSEVGYPSTDMADVNGDGYLDLIFGGTPSSGTAVTQFSIVLSSSTRFDDIIYTESAAYRRVLNEQADDFFGYELISTGDFDNDGLADIVVSAPFYDPLEDDTDHGAVYVVYGADLVAADVEENITDIMGHKFTGEVQTSSDTNMFPGSAIVATDLDGNGVDDLVLGSKGVTKPNINPDYGPLPAAGAVYILYDATLADLAVASDPTTDLTVADFKLAQDSVYLTTEQFLDTASNDIGRSLAAADFNNDGHNDIVVGADNDIFLQVPTSYVVPGPLVESIASVVVPTSSSVTATAQRQVAIQRTNSDGSTVLYKSFKQKNTEAPKLFNLRVSGYAAQLKSNGTVFVLRNYVTGHKFTKRISRNSYLKVSMKQFYLHSDRSPDFVITSRRGSKVLVTVIHPQLANNIISKKSILLQGGKYHSVVPSKTQIQQDSAKVNDMIELRNAKGDIVQLIEVTKKYDLVVEE